MSIISQKKINNKTSINLHEYQKFPPEIYRIIIAFQLISVFVSITVRLE